MKANEAPEKIHVLSNVHDRWFEGKIPSSLPDGVFVEYTRTDAFIEKAWDWVEDNILSSNQKDKSRLYYEQFRKYMKGE